MSVLEARDLSIRFGGLQAAREVTIHVDEFEIVGIIGPNGAGKTTTFNMITGFYTPDSGSVWYRGRDITQLKVHERAALSIGRTFQNVGLVKGSTVRENLLTAQHLSARYGIVGGMIGSPVAVDEERIMRRRADALLEVLQLGRLADTRVAGLPYGDLKRVEIATVLATDPEVLLLDEPSSGRRRSSSGSTGPARRRRCRPSPASCSRPAARSGSRATRSAGGRRPRWWPRAWRSCPRVAGCSRRSRWRRT